MSWMKHAFHVDPPGPAEPTDSQQFSVDWVCTQIAKRQLTTPGLIFLELTRPLNWIGAQTMHFMQPGVWAILNERRLRGYDSFSRFLEQRGSMDYLCQRVEHFEAEFTRVEEAGESIAAFIKEHLQSVWVPDEPEATTERDSTKELHDTNEAD